MLLIHVMITFLDTIAVDFVCRSVNVMMFFSAAFLLLIVVCIHVVGSGRFVTGISRKINRATSPDSL